MDFNEFYNIGKGATRKNSGWEEKEKEWHKHQTKCYLQNIPLESEVDEAIKEALHIVSAAPEQRRCFGAAMFDVAGHGGQLWWWCRGGVHGSSDGQRNYSPTGRLGQTVFGSITVFGC